MMIKDPSVHSVISKHITENSGHDMDRDNIKILHSENQQKKRCKAEMVHIKKQKNKALNKITDLKNFPQAYEATVHDI